MASRLTALPKESGVAQNLDDADDAYAAQRAELDTQFRALPPGGTDDYWRTIEGSGAQQPLPIEILARCLRERHRAGAVTDAERIFNVILRRVQSSVQHWAWGIARQAQSGIQPEDLEQQCYMELWEELADDGRTFLFVHFAHALRRLRGHVAHNMMQRAGVWQRPGVQRPRRIPRDLTDSLLAVPEGEDGVPLVDQVPGASAEDVFDQAELSDLFALVMTLPADQRMIIFDRFWDGLPQEETAEKLGISDRMVRYRLKKILRNLKGRYRGTEEDDHV